MSRERRIKSFPEIRIYSAKDLTIVYDRRRTLLRTKNKGSIKNPFIKGERLVSPREESVLLKSIFISAVLYLSLFPLEAADLLAIPFFSLFIHLCFSLALASTNLFFSLSRALFWILLGYVRSSSSRYTSSKMKLKVFSTL